MANISFYFLVLFVMLALFTGVGEGWRRRRRRRCASNPCVWHWSSCSRTCGGGYQYPIKTADNGPCGSCNMPSILSTDSKRSCNTQCCPVHCSWRSWGSWGSCSLTCGGGRQTRVRGRSTPSCGGRGCSGSASESRSCNPQCCPVHCAWSVWGSWGPCSQTCGGGSQTRSRGYATSASCGGNACPGSPQESRVCNAQCCPVDCAWSLWSSWSGCTVTCGGGAQYRERGQDPVMSCGGKTCPGKPGESRTCNSQCCPVNCAWGEWSRWSACTKSCGIGTQERNRPVLVPSYCGGAECSGPGLQTQSCNEHCCQVDCRWGPWGGWGDCSKTCEKGDQSRSRVVDVESSCGGQACHGTSLDSRYCNDVCCPVHCQWEEWSDWTRCTKTCGSGKQSRRRAVKVAAVCRGEECAGNAEEERNCNTACCPVDCLLSDWGDWQQCSTTCGATGLQRRHRNVIRELSCGGQPCDPILFQDNQCNRFCFNGGSIAAETCACVPGWRGDCCEHDVNECDSPVCMANSNCLNTDGSYDCACQHGYSKENEECVDVDECHLQMHDCHKDAECVNLEGHFTCRCYAGFTGNGTTCTDVDECALEDQYDYRDDDESESELASDHSSPLCHDDATCSNTYGSYLCTCNTGYAGDGVTCEDINECSFMSKNITSSSTSLFSTTARQLADAVSHVSSCDAHATCVNNKGSYSCWCDDGFYGDGYTCHEIDECESSPCQHEGTCHDLVNSFECVCVPGYTGTLCESEINECNPSPCQNSGSCLDLLNSFQCLCWPGYAGLLCDADIDECQMYEGSGGSGTDRDVTDGSGDVEKLTSCHSDAICTNTYGSYECSCIQGFAGDGFTCIDIDECEVFNSSAAPGLSLSWSGEDGISGSGAEGSGFLQDCDVHASCHNYAGGYNCSCNIGYRGNGFECEDVNECLLGTDACDRGGGKCFNTIGSHICACKDGYTGNGATCTDIDECASGAHHCSPGNGICANLPGGYSCQCKTGYSGDGKICTDINECDLGFHSCKGEHELCVNNEGGYSCNCGSYFEMRNGKCIDKNECTAEDQQACTGEHRVCKNLIGGFKCDCAEGFEDKKGRCTDVDECSLGIHCKGRYQRCVNTDGGFRCGCQDLMVMKDGECKERIPEMHSDTVTPPDSSLAETFTTPAILIVLILAGLTIIAIVFVAVRIARRPHAALINEEPPVSGTTFTNRSFVNTETPAEVAETSEEL